MILARPWAYSERTIKARRNDHSDLVFGDKELLVNAHLPSNWSKSPFVALTCPKRRLLLEAAASVKLPGYGVLGHGFPHAALRAGGA
ncbi:MAG: hypothetical protein AAB403_18495, partial [Planctomycetota bacterium]